MAKKRLLALDGLRGFAALSVVISHLGINIQPIVAVPAVNFFFRMISSGTTAVQLFFVLSGFLMAYLYPVVGDSFRFLSQRYLRIMPLYATVVVYIWWIQFHNYGNFWLSFAALLVLALIVYWLWRGLKWGKWIFILFLLFQAGYVIFSLTLMPDLVAGARGNLDNWQKQTLYMLSNLTMTMYLQKRLVVSSGVLWSLVPEMLFYLIYPFMVAPVVSWLSKQRWWLVLLAGSAVIKILFDLDMASRSFYSLHGIYIARASGFAVGLLLGRIFYNQGRAWKKLEGILSRPAVNLAVLGVFFLALAVEWPDRYYQIREYVAWHFLGLSLIFGLTLAAGLIAKSWTERFFAQKWLGFLGMISYSLYLIHPEVINLLAWNPMLVKLGQMKVLIIASVCIGVAWGLYWLIERLYFISKKPVMKPGVLMVKPSRIKTGLVVGLGVAVMIWIYSGDYALSSIMVRQRHMNQPGQPYKFELMAKEPNLSVVWLSLDYARDPGELGRETAEETQLVFRLQDSNGQEIFTSSRSPKQLEGQLQYPFGFSVQADSKGKKYWGELSLENAGLSEEIHINKGPGVVTQYVTEKSFKVKYMANLAYRRLVFAFSGMY